MDEDWKRRRKREDEDDEDKVELSLAQKRGAVAQPGAMPSKSGSLPSEKLDELLQRAEPMIEQLNNLYAMFFSGVEARAPIERRKNLDQLMYTLQLTAKPTSAMQFRYNTLYNHFMVMRDKWDRMMKDLENGKIRRVTGPKARSG